MSYHYNREEHHNSCCAEFLCFMFLLLMASMIKCSYHVKIDEYNLDMWDRQNGLDPCCRRDHHGIIRDRITNKVQWKKMLKDDNPYWADIDWDDYILKDDE